MYKLSFTIAILVACRYDHPVYVPPTAPAVSGRTAGIPAAQLDALSREPAAAHWGDVVAEVTQLLRDPQFRDRLTHFTEIDARAGDPTTGREVAAALLGDHRAPSQVPTQYLITNDDPACKHQTASTGIADDKFARTVLNPCTIARSRTPKTAAYACAINTAAHEMTHTVLDEKNVQLYQDGSHKHATTPLVSYTVGAIAQCLYLSSIDSLAASMFDSCVQQAGTTSFNPNTCDESWLLTLKGIRPDEHAP